MALSCKMRPFDDQDWMAYAGCVEPKSGAPVMINETEINEDEWRVRTKLVGPNVEYDVTVIVDGSGVGVHLIDTGDRVDENGGPFDLQAMLLETDNYAAALFIARNLDPKALTTVESIMETFGILEFQPC